jgi:predicted NBD/HSP70 family sugar kinase
VDERAGARKHPPVLDPGFAPAVSWNRAYRTRVAADPGRTPLELALTRPDGSVFRARTEVLPHEGGNAPLNLKHVERLVKLLLWTRGGSEVLVAGHDGLAAELAAIYGPRGARAFDNDFLGRRVFLDRLRVRPCGIGELPEARDEAVPLGRHLDGCRIGFDLGGSDRKCAAVIDGRVVHSEEVAWSPYFESDPAYHYEGITDSLRRAAAHLPRVDAIGGSSAGVWVDSEPRAGSLFRGISEADFDLKVRPMFRRLRKEWNDVPLCVANDGEVTALAASMQANHGALLGIAMGTSLAAGYCDPHGRITRWLNELAFVPMDYRDDAPADEWSGDVGCGVQYLSQQAVARLAPAAGLEFPEEMPLATRLEEVQALMQRGDPRPGRIYETIGAYLGYAIAWYAEWYTLEGVLVLGRVSSGPGGELILEKVREVLRDELPEGSGEIRLLTPDESFKRHGQAIAAASLPSLVG